MRREDILKLLEGVASGGVTVAEAMEGLARLPFETLGYATLDAHRALRRGFPEVVFAEGKRDDHLVGIVARLAATGDPLLVTRLSPARSPAVVAAAQSAVRSLGRADLRVAYHESARVLEVRTADRPDRGIAPIPIVCAGTSDLAVADEAAVTVEALGSTVVRVADVGISGVHRLTGHLPVLRAARVVVVCAGMEGALPSLIGGLVACPVVAVPTSVGYGVSRDGIAAVLAMLASCVPGVVVVNVDNGFGAGFAAALINRRQEHSE